MRYSRIGEKLTAKSGIVQLMDDLGESLTLFPDVKMLGGGTPAHIPEVQQLWRQRMADGLATKELDAVLANYDPPRGNPRFLAALAHFLQQQCGWDVTAENLVVTPGGQAAFFILFNLLAGEMPDGEFRKILLPLMPEYIGYCDQGLAESQLLSCPPTIEYHASDRFKYRIDFDVVKQHLAEEPIGAICVSRPTNPSGNVLTSSEIQQLTELGEQHGVPLIVDNAYGMPFPGVIFNEPPIEWTPRHVFSLSLSKLGLPGTRTGIVVAPRELAERIARCVGVIGLANTNVGQWLITPLLEDGSLSRVCQTVVEPFYRAKSDTAQELVKMHFDRRFEYRVHVSEGAFFLWLWFPGLPIPTLQLYEKLKANGVIVVPGEYFFFGSEQDDSHHHECIRISFAQPEETLNVGLQIIADTVAQL